MVDLEIEIEEVQLDEEAHLLNSKSALENVRCTRENVKVLESFGHVLTFH